MSFDEEQDQEQDVGGDVLDPTGWVDTDTGEEAQILAALDQDQMDGLSSFPITAEQRDKLLRPPETEEVQIRPDGAVFISHAGYRRRLNDAFQPMGWGLRRVSPHMIRDNMLMAEYQLYVLGHLVGTAFGEQAKSSRTMTFGDMTEGVKSNALMRICKDMGMFLMCWTKSWTDQWKADNAVAVWVEGTKRPQWRLKNAPKLFKEKGPVATERSEKVTGQRTNGAASTESQRDQRRMARTLPNEAVPEPAQAPDARPALDRPVSAAEGENFWKIVGDSGYQVSAVAKWLRTQGIERTSDITLSQYQRLVKIFKDESWDPTTATL